MNWIRLTYSLIEKEFLTEFRQKDFLFSMLFFTIAVILIINFSFPGSQSPPQKMLALVFWIPLVFSATLVIGRVFNAERDSQNFALLALFPKPPSIIFVSKVLATFSMMIALHILLFVFVFFFLNIPFTARFTSIIIPVLLCDIGLSTLGSLIAGVFMRHRNRDALLPILLFPLSMPLLIGGVQMSQQLILATGPLSFENPWLMFLLILDTTYLTLSYLLFEFLFEEH